MIKLTITGGPELAATLREKGPAIIERLRIEMTSLMIQLQSQILTVELPRYFPDGAPNIAGEVRVIPTTVEGTLIHGEVQAGGARTTKETLGGPNAGRPVDYAAVQEEGVAHGWEIQPVLYGIAQAVSQRNRAIAGLPRALAFVVGGRTVIVRRVWHPPLVPRPFMQSGLEDMETKIIADLKAAISEAIAA